MCGPSNRGKSLIGKDAPDQYPTFNLLVVRSNRTRPTRKINQLALIAEGFFYGCAGICADGARLSDAFGVVGEVLRPQVRVA